MINPPPAFQVQLHTTQQQATDYIFNWSSHQNELKNKKIEEEETSNDKSKKLGYMGYSNAETGGCRRHPNQKQIPGVCSFCLRERLSRLTTHDEDDVDNSFKTPNSAFSEASSLSSPPPNRTHRKNGSVDVAAPLGFLLHQGTANANLHAAGLKKSKSVAWAPRRSRNATAKAAGDDKDDKPAKKQGGLWNKLIHSTTSRNSKNKGVLLHSMTTLNDRSQDTHSFRIS